MTKKKDLKALVRERQAKTGESYMVAKRAVLARSDEGLKPPERATLLDETKYFIGADGLTRREDGTVVQKFDRVEFGCDTPYGECVLPKGHSSDEHGGDHQKADGTWWNVGQTKELAAIAETPMLSRRFVEALDDVKAAKVRLTEAEARLAGEPMLHELAQEKLGPSERPCLKCGQIDHGQYGEHPCSECGLPTVWDEIGRHHGRPVEKDVVLDFTKLPTEVGTGKVVLPNQPNFTETVLDVKFERFPRADGAEHCPTEYGECVLPKGHTNDEHGDSHQKVDGTWWNVGTMFDASNAQSIAAAEDERILEELKHQTPSRLMGEDVEYLRTKAESAARHHQLAEEAQKVYTAAKQSPTEAMKLAFEAWGITVGKDAKLTTRDGKALRAKWTPEVSKDLESFHSGSAEVEMARLTMDAVFLALYGEDKPRMMVDVGDVPPDKVEPLIAEVRQRFEENLRGQQTYLVWETEYPGEGSFEIEATSEEGAKAQYRKDTGSDDELELDAVLLTPELAATRTRLDEANWQSLPCGHQIQIDGFGASPDGELLRLRLEGELEHHRSLACLNKFPVALGDQALNSMTARLPKNTWDSIATEPLSKEVLESAAKDTALLKQLRFNPSPDGNDSNFFGKGYERLSCGHLVMSPDSQQMKDSAEDLLAFHGLDAVKELREAAAHERLQHTSGECLKPGWADKQRAEDSAGKGLLEGLMAKKGLELSVKDVKPVSKPFDPTKGVRLPDGSVGKLVQEPTKHLIGPIENETELVPLRGFERPVPKALAEWAEQAREKARQEIMADPNFIRATRGPAQVASENARREFAGDARPISSIGSLVAGDEPQTILDDKTFEVVKLEKLPCGHSVRQSSEIPQDLKALWGQAGVEGFERVFQEQRQKHLEGRCSEATDTFKLIPKRDFWANRITMVLADSAGKILWPTDRKVVDVDSGISMLTINAEAAVQSGELTAVEGERVLEWRRANRVLMEASKFDVEALMGETPFAPLPLIPEQTTPAPRLLTHPRTSAPHTKLDPDPILNALVEATESRVMVDGRYVEVKPHTVWSYADAVKAAGYDPERVLSVTYRVKSGKWRCEGILSPGQAVELLPGMVFNVADTSSA